MFTLCYLFTGESIKVGVQCFVNIRIYQLEILYFTPIT